MSDTPRTRRLRSDFRAMERLRADSSILDFDFKNDPPNRYRVVFRGAGFFRQEHSTDVLVRDLHEVKIDLNAAYPRMIPDLSWKTPIFHPNISASGVVCLGGYSTHWAPSLTLDELCVMLWDMIRYKNFDVESPYNREAAIWAKAGLVNFPIDDRPLRDRISGDAPRTNTAKPPVKKLKSTETENARQESSNISDSRANQPESRAEELEPPDVVFIDSEVVDAEIIRSDDSDIMFID